MRVLRLVLSAGIVAGGLGAAWPFRHKPSALPPQPSRLRTDVPLRQPDIVLEASPVSAHSPASGLGNESALDEAAADQRVLRPDFDALAPPPALPQDFGPPAAAGPHSRCHWQPVRMKLPAAAPSMRRHRVTDGDSLERLAERYLGDATRAGEIFEANRDLLAAPDLLPLGRILRIP